MDRKKLTGRKVILNKDTKYEEEVLLLYPESTEFDENTQEIDLNTIKCSFILGEKLGKGAFGIVRMGINKQTGEKVAIKILEKSQITNDNDKGRIIKEINVLKKMHHPNIVKLFSVVNTDRQLYIIMEYIRGKELYQHLLLNKKLPEKEACFLYHQIISGIEYLQEIKVAHRDLKAENLLIEKDELKIIDFGLSNNYSNDSYQLLSTVCGSPCYAAPEMLSGKMYKGGPVDVWSSGIILYYMLCGNLPFNDTSEDTLFKKICKGKFDKPKVSKDAVDLINKILNIDPQKRIKVKEIKKHPWMKINTEGNIDNTRGLCINKYVIPIDENIVDEINNRYDIEKELIRTNILANKYNDISTLYYLTLQKQCRDYSHSIADMKSDLFNEYIKDKNNLLKKYNNDINTVINCRKFGVEYEKEHGLDQSISVISNSKSSLNNTMNQKNQKNYYAIHIKNASNYSRGIDKYKDKKIYDLKKKNNNMSMVVNKNNSKIDISTCKNQQQSTIVKKNKINILNKRTNQTGKLNKKKFLGGISARQNNSIIKQSLKQNTDSVINSNELTGNYLNNKVNNDEENNEVNKGENKNNEVAKNNTKIEEIKTKNENNKKKDDKIVSDNENKNYKADNYKTEKINKIKKVNKIKLAINPRTAKNSNVLNPSKNYSKTSTNKKLNENSKKSIDKSYENRSGKDLKFHKKNSHSQIKKDESVKNLCITQRNKPDKIFNCQNNQKDTFKRNDEKNITHKKIKSIDIDNKNGKTKINKTLNKNDYHTRKRSVINNENIFRPFDLISLFSKNEKNLIDKVKLICEKNKLKVNMNLSNKFTISYLTNNLMVEFDIINKGNDCFIMNIKKVNGSDKIYIKEMNKLVYRMNTDK